MIKRLLVTAIAAALPFVVQAEVKTVTWTNATQNTDGTAIASTGLGALTRTVVEYGTRTSTGGFGTKQGEIGVAAPATTLQVNLVVVQQYALRAFHCNGHAGTTYVLNGTGCSVASNVALTEVVAPIPKPNPPTSLSVPATSPVVYTVSKVEGAFAAVPVGEVPAGTMCNTEEGYLDPDLGMLYVVPTSAVTWFGGVRDIVVVATCG